MSDTDNDSATLAGTLRIADDSDSDSDVDSHAYSAHPSRDFDDAESLSSWGTAVPSTPASLSASSSCASSEKGYRRDDDDREDDERGRERGYDGRDGRDVRSWQERTVTFASGTGTARLPGSEAGAGTNSSLWTPWKGWKTRSAAKESVRSSIRDFVLSDEPLSRSSALQEAQTLLSSLHDTCTQLQLSTPLASILQDRYIQGHSPLYWCIVKKRPITASVKTASSLNSSLASISILKSAKSDSSSTGSKKSDSKADLGSGSGAKIAKSYSTPKLPSLITLPSAKAKAASATVDLFPMFLAHALPITSKTLIAELRAACREAGDNASFQRLRLDVPRFSHAHAYRRRSNSRGEFDGDDASVYEGGGGSARGYEQPYVRPGLNVDGKEEVMEDDIKVVLRDHLEREAFAVEMRFPDFSERLRTRRIVGAEFVVRDRIWLFAFAHRYVPALAQDQSQFQTRADVRAWTAELSIRDKSPSTWFSGDLLVVPPAPSSSTSSSAMVGAGGMPPRKMGSRVDEKAQPVRIGTDSEPLSSANGNSIWVKLDGSPAFASLQHAECPYLDEDGTLHIRLEGRLENEGGW